MTLIEQAEKAFDQEQALKAAEKLTGRRRLHPRRLPRADAAGPQARLDVEDHGDAARDGAVPRPARELRRARDRPDPGDHPVDDAGRAGQPQDDRRLPTGPDRPRLRSPGLRRQQPGRPLLRGPQDDAVLRQGRRDARPARDARHVGGGKRGRAKQAAKNKPGKGRRVCGNPAKAAAAAGRRRGRPTPWPTRSANPTARRSTTRRPPPRSTCRRTSRSSSSEVAPGFWLIARDEQSAAEGSTSTLSS